MSQATPAVRGYVVDHKESNVRYAVSESNFNPNIHTKVRELKQAETVLAFRPRRTQKATPTPSAAPSSEGSKNTTK